MKEKPKAKQTGKQKAKRAETTRGAQTAQGANPSARDTANPSAANGAANGAAAGGFDDKLFHHNRETVRRFISELPNDCALICDTVKNSLYDDGAGLLEDEELYKRLGRIAYIDNFIRYFGGYLAIEDLAVILNDLFPKDLQTAGAVDMKQLERVPTLDRELLNDILEGEYDDKTCFHNLALYYFSLWVNIHVGAVVSMFRKWVEVYGDNVPPVLRDMSALARCVCVYTRTEDNAHGGIFYDGAWFESFAMCGARRRKRNAEAAAARDLARTVAEPVARPNPSAAQGANPSARDTAKPSEPVGNGAAVFNITAAAVNVQAATVEMPEPKAATDGRASEPERNAGHTAGGVSQTVMAGFMGVVKKTVCRWENHPDKYPPPIVDGKRYEKGIRENGAGAFVFAQRYKDTQQGAVKITRGAGAIGIAEKQAAESWIRDNSAALRSVGADLSEW